MTELLTRLEKRVGMTVGYNDQSSYDAAEHEGRVGQHGFDKNLSLDHVITIASRMEVRPNVIVKAGENAKWYMFYILNEHIEAEIYKQRWRDTHNCTLWAIEW